jgi:hypothetical protein
MKPTFILHRLPVVQNLCFECHISDYSAGVRTLCSSIDYHSLESYFGQDSFIVATVSMLQVVSYLFEALLNNVDITDSVCIKSA